MLTQMTFCQKKDTKNYITQSTLCRDAIGVFYSLAKTSPMDAYLAGTVEYTDCFSADG